jgi:23S rRNA (adenine2503-C2)-methyltransferase
MFKKHTLFSHSMTHNYAIKTASDGTKKVLYAQGHSCVVIPSKDEKWTVCVSCQIGCPVGCHFCHTGKLVRNLSCDEILEQVRDATSIIGKMPTSIVFMGMGEPMTNYIQVSQAITKLNQEFGFSYKQITLSTSCVRLELLLDVKYHVALSLHSPFDEVRKTLIPGAMPVAKIVTFANEYSAKRKHGIMIEYALIQGINDRDCDLDKLISLGFSKNTYFNIIQYNSKGVYKASDKLLHFKESILQAGYKCFIRHSRGSDIDAACGMLDNPSQ